MKNRYFIGISHLITRYKNTLTLPVVQEEVSLLHELLVDTETQLQLLDESFRDSCLEIMHPGKMKRWCNSIQMLVVLFSDTLFLFKQMLHKHDHRERKNEWTNKLEDFLSILQTFLFDLLNADTENFDASKFVSLYEADGLRVSLSTQIKKIRRQWKTISKADEALERIALSPFEEFINETCGQRHSYDFISFLKNLSAQLEKTVFSGCTEKDKALLIECLIRTNFNAPDFIKYNKMQLMQLLNANENTETRLDFLYTQQNHLHQIVTERKNGYYQQKASATEQLDCFLEDEIIYLKRKIPVLSAALQEAKKPVVLHFNIPVDSIAILLRMMVETGIIKTSNLSQMINTIVPFLQSKHKENIRPESFRNKYYSPDLNHVNAVKDLLYEMIKGLRGLQ